MSSWGAEVRRIEAGQRRNERDARKRQKELDRQLKERAKLSALDQARLDVAAHENALEVLLSVHKEQNTPVDWRRFACALPPHEPPRLARHELAALLHQAVSEASPSTQGSDARLEAAVLLDEQEHAIARAEYEREFAHWERLYALAHRVLAGEPKAYIQAVSEFPNLGEISNLGSSIHLTVHSAKLIECELKVNGRDLIPHEIKSLTAAGKLAVKPMPKARFHEIYQDYVCACVLRLAREMLALLPIETVLLTATVDGIDLRIGHAAELPVLSMAVPRAVVERLDFEHLDPSAALENFPHRGDVSASKKSDAFVAIAPLRLEEIAIAGYGASEFASLTASVRRYHTELGALLKSAASEPPREGESTDLSF